MTDLRQRMQQDMRIRNLSPRTIEAYAGDLRHLREHLAARGIDRVERVGNLNYPDAARREGITGKLLLDVALNPDGTVRNITVLRPSGHSLLDEAAIRIVSLAGPYAPFPPEIRKNADVLHITRTWEFSTTNRMQTR